MFFLPVIPDKFVRLAGIDVEHALPCRPCPLGGHCDETEEEALDPARSFHPEETHEQQLNQKAVQLPGDVEVVGLPRILRSVCQVSSRKFLNGAENRVSAGDTGAETLCQYVTKKQVDVLHAVSATEIYGEQGTDNLAVLIAEICAADSQGAVYHVTKKSVEFVQDKIYSAKSGGFLIFKCYLCHAIDDFAFLVFAALR